MSGLLEAREKIKIFFSKNQMYIEPTLKFVLAICVIFLLNNKIGYMSVLVNPVVVFVAALICAVLPMNVTLAIGAIYMIGNGFALSLEVAIVTVVMLLLMFLLYYRFSPKDACVIILVPVACAFHIPYLAPLLVGLMAAPVSMIPMTFGIIIYYFVEFVGGNSGVLASTADTDMFSKISLILENVFSDREMILILVAFLATVVVTYMVRRLNIDYAWTMASVVGTLTMLLIMLVGQYMLNTDKPVGGMIVSMVISFGLAMAMQLFAFCLDYSRTEYVQFEDDEYYYYVKAVPKMNVSATEKKVKNITSRKKFYEE